MKNFLLYIPLIHLRKIRNSVTSNHGDCELTSDWSSQNMLKLNEYVKLVLYFICNEMTHFVTQSKAVMRH